ncbi:MAG: hypothetical protein KBS80_02415 [Bacteroidales bacterium]|nr:hypothetical protein [Candidatus Cryptobacteroides choladohippi]
MKRLAFYFILATAVLAGCTKANVDGQKQTESSMADNSVIAAYLDDAANTKLSLVEGVKLAWAADDMIYFGGKRYVIDSIDPDDPTKAFFKPQMSAAADAEIYRAFYPYTAYSSSAGKFVLSSTQNYGLNDKVTNVNSMYAETTKKDELHFHNVCGLLAIDIKGTGTVSNIKVSADQYLSGSLTNMAVSEDGVLTYGDITISALNYVNLGCGKVATLSTDEARRFYVAVPENDYTNLKIAITTEDGTMVVAATKTASVKKNNIYHIPEINFEVKPLEFSVELSIDECEAVSTSEVNLAVSSVPSDKDVYYIRAVETIDYVSQFADGLALAKDDLAYWKMYYSTIDQLVNKGVAVKGDVLKDSELFNYCLPDNDYVFYAYAVDEYLNVSAATIKEFHTPAFVLPPATAKYEDYLGQWLMGTTLLTVSEKVNGSSYSVTGFKGQSSAAYNYNVESVEAAFEDGYIVFKEYNTGVRASLDEEDDSIVYFSGMFISGGTEYAAYPFNTEAPTTIFYGRYDGDKVSVIPGSCKWGTFTSTGFAAVIQSGEYAGYGDSISNGRISDMQKYVEPTGPTPEGTWYCASVTDFNDNVFTDWTMTITRSGIGFEIDGFDLGLASMTPTAPTAIWNAVDQTLTVPNGTDTCTDYNGAAFYWYGMDEDGYDADIVIKFDLENNKCQFQTYYWGAYVPYYESFWDIYIGSSMTFTKVTEEAASSVKAMGNGMKVGGTLHSDIKPRSAAVSRKAAPMVKAGEFASKAKMGGKFPLSAE